MTKEEYLDKYIFKYLRNLNTGFDSPNIKYFTAEDFLIVLKRVEERGLGIYGIEPWDLDNHYYDTKTYEEFARQPDDSDWYQAAFIEFNKTDLKLQYSASYFVPEELLKK